MTTIKVERAGKYAHKAIFTDAYGVTREVFTLNGEGAALQAAKNRINESLVYAKPKIRIKNPLAFIRKLISRRAKNKIASKSRKFNLIYK